MPVDFLRKIQETIGRYQMFHRGDRVVVAVSGGPDSMALLGALHHLKSRYGLDLWAAHYNHRIRGSEADDEAEFVRRQTQRIGIPLVAQADDGFLERPQGNLEESARERRYSFLEKAAANVGAQRVALGHTANDQVETFFLRLFRGAGTKGLGSIPPVRGDLFIRPLIEIKRSDVLDFLHSRSIPWVEDSSNQKTTFLRNKIRLRLFPELINLFGAGLIKKIGSATNLLRDDEEYLEEVSLRKYRELRSKDKSEEVSLDISELTKLPIALQRRVIRHAIQEFNKSLRRISLSHMEAIGGLLQSGCPHARISLPDGVLVQRVYRRLTIGHPVKKTVEFYHEFHALPDEILIPEIGRTITARVMEWKGMPLPPPDRNSAFMDFERVKFPLIVRNWRAGDRFHPLGAPGIKKLKHYFIDVKVPRAERDTIPLTIFGDLIAWIGGERIDHRVRITDSTKRALLMKIY